jgi:hypothetical protein
MIPSYITEQFLDQILCDLACHMYALFETHG